MIKAEVPKVTRNQLCYFFISTITIFNLGCAVFPMHKNPQASHRTLNTKITVEIENTISSQNGEPLGQNDTSVIQYANKALQGCMTACESEAIVKLRFASTEPQEMALTKAWLWAGILTFGLIPVVDKTEFTLIADIEYSGKSRHFEERVDRYFVFSILLLPVRLFRSWHEDMLGAQKHLIDALANDLGASLAKEPIIEKQNK